jgi:hypothetical protein
VLEQAVAVMNLHSVGNPKHDHWPIAWLNARSVRIHFFVPADRLRTTRHFRTMIHMIISSDDFTNLSLTASTSVPSTLFSLDSFSPLSRIEREFGGSIFPMIYRGLDSADSSGSRGDYITRDHMRLCVREDISIQLEMHCEHSVSFTVSFLLKPITIQYPMSPCGHPQWRAPSRQLSTSPRYWQKTHETVSY